MALTGFARAQCANVWVGEPGFSGAPSIRALAVLPNGDIIVGGEFASIGGVAASCIGRWNGVAWSPLGAGIASTFGSAEVRALAVLPTGDLVAGGSFTSAGGAAAMGIARWNGAVWSAIPGLQLFEAVHALAVLPNGDLVAGGGFVGSGPLPLNNVARWDGSRWFPFASGVVGSVLALAVLPGGDVVVGGTLTAAGGLPVNRMARWNGAYWTTMGGVLSSITGVNYWVSTLVVMPDGGIVAGGSFNNAGGVWANNIARWNTSNWQALGTGMAGAWPFGFANVNSLALLPGGDLAAGGRFTSAGGVATYQLARWSGTSWSALGAAFDPTGEVHALATSPVGQLVVGGSFNGTSAVPTGNVVRLGTTCPAIAAVHGAGCVGSGGAVTLEATTLPWLGTALQSRALNLGNSQLAIAVYGFGTASLALPTILPQGVPGCTLFVTPATLSLLTPVLGVASAHVAIPNAPALANQIFFHQVVPLELAPSGAIAAATSSNALHLTIGLF